MNWGQIQTILWLRWRLTRNQWSRQGQLNAVISMVVALIGLILGASGVLIGLLLGFFAFDDASPIQMLIVWDGVAIAFLFFWLIGLISEIQRSETIDINRLIHLPISLKGIFVINYLASHLTPAIILFVPFMTGLCIGLVFSHGAIMLALLPLVLGFVFMISSWTYCLRGWLATLMTNQRRRRAVIAGITFGFIILFQMPNLYFNVIARNRRHRPPTNTQSQSNNQTPGTDNRNEPEVPKGLLLAHKIVPFLWIGNGAMATTNGSLLPALLGTAGGFALAGLGMRRAYRTTINFYQGTTKRKTRKKAKEEKIVNHKNRLDESLPGVADETSALALAFFQNLKRASEVKMALATNFFMLFFFSAMIMLRHNDNIGESTMPFITTGAIMVSFFGLMQIMFNLFGFDRNGFRTLVLSPVPRKYILHAKNLSVLPLAMCFGGLLILITRLILHIPLLNFLAAILQLITAFLLLSMVGNIASIIVPFRVTPGSMKRTKMPALTIVLMIIVQLFFFVFLSPILIPPVVESLLSNTNILPAGVFNLSLSIVLLIVVFYCYRISLAPTGNLLQKREKKILEVVTKEIE